MATKAIYVKTPSIWEAAEEIAKRRGTSLSHYVEMALAKHNLENSLGYSKESQTPTETFERPRGRKGAWREWKENLGNNKD